jgi:L-galactose dehydrogenase
VLARRVEASLARLHTDYIDIYQLHAVTPEDYAYAQGELVPALVKMRDQGKIRFIGITEGFVNDPGHAMLQQALHDDVWDVIMVGFNILNQSARDTVLPMAIKKDIGVLDMFAVRKALTRSEVLAGYIQDMVDQGIIDKESIDRRDPLGFLIHSGAATSLPDAAYRFVRYEPGIHCVLVGTGKLDHLQANAQSLHRPPLPDEVATKLRGLFQGVDSVSGN